MSRLQDGARVLELGCGAGVPDTQRLAARFQVTGVDVSPEQVRRARAAVPRSRVCASRLHRARARAGVFDAVVSFYAFNHVPRELLAPTLARIHRWLVPGGRLMPALGTSDMEAWTGDGLVLRRSSRAFRRRPTLGSCARPASRSFATSSSPSASPMATRPSSGSWRCGPRPPASPRPNVLTALACEQLPLPAAPTLAQRHPTELGHQSSSAGHV